MYGISHNNTILAVIFQSTSRLTKNHFFRPYSFSSASIKPWRSDQKIFPSRPAPSGGEKPNEIEGNFLRDTLSVDREMHVRHAHATLTHHPYYPRF